MVSFKDRNAPLRRNFNGHRPSLHRNINGNRYRNFNGHINFHGYARCFSRPTTLHDHRREPNTPWGLGLRDSRGVKEVNTLFIDNLRKSMTNIWLRQMFKNEGKVIDVFVPNKNCVGKQFKFRFVRFRRHEEVEKAIRIKNGMFVKGKRIIVQRARFEKIVFGLNVKQHQEAFL